MSLTKKLLTTLSIGLFATTSFASNNNNEEIDKRNYITVAFNNPLDIKFTGSPSGPDMDHNFTTSVGDIKVDVARKTGPMTYETIQTLSLAKNEKKRVEKLDHYFAPIETANGNIVVTAQLIGDNPRMPAGVSQGASCENITLGSDVTFTIKLAGKEYKLTCSHSNPFGK